MSFPDRSPQQPEERTAEQVRHNWVERRRAKISEEIARNRRGEYTVPTWVLAVALLLIVGAWVTLVALS